MLYSASEGRGLATIESGSEGGRCHPAGAAAAEAAAGKVVGAAVARTWRPRKVAPVAKALGQDAGAPGRHGAAAAMEATLEPLPEQGAAPDQDVGWGSDEADAEMTHTPPAQ